MSVLIERGGVLAEFFQKLRGELGQFPEGRPGRWEATFPPEFRFPFEQADALALFPKFCWQARHSVVRRLALTAVWSGEVPGPDGGFDGLPGDEFCGGQAFAGGGGDGEGWPGFGAARWFLPGMEIVETMTGVRLRVRWQEVPPWENLVCLEAFLGAVEGQAAPNVPEAWSRHDNPNFHRWQAAVGEALEKMESGDLEKVVLARCSSFELSEAGLPFVLWQALTRQAPDCFHFLFVPDAGAGAFLGASPELLYARRGQLLQTEAIAGTRPRNLDPTEEERMEAELLGQEKERREHAIVVRELLAGLAELCAEVTQPSEPQILKLQRVQHLRTPLEGRLRDGVSDREILARLHPTPATCGMPTERALRVLAKLEKFSRGWYAGPIGWVGRGEAICAVAIRSMRLRAGILEAYAGAGIVPGSEAEKEWAELESKIGGILRMISL
jgi:menaquinone-specific isochorismate synthase